MRQAFVIMQIGNAELDKVAARAIVPAIEACGLAPKRVDKHNEGGLLKSEIVRFIQDSDIIIADLTNERPNCYLEIGYAMGLDKLKNLILTSREDHFHDSKNYQKDGPKIHFDLLGYDVLSWSPDALDLFREELEKRIQRRLAIISPAIDAEPARLERDWFAEQRKIADSAMAGTGYEAYMELSFALTGHDSFPLSALNRSAEKAAIHAFGWPIGIYLHVDDAKPRPREDGIAATVYEKNHPSFDYWALRRNGDYFWRGSLFEDERDRNQIFIDTRIVRVTEALLYCGRLYSQLGLDRARVVSVQVKHIGFRGRHLSSASQTRRVDGKHVSQANESTVAFNVRLEEIETNLVPLVKDVIAPLLELFEFFEIHNSIYEDIVNKFVASV